MTSTLKILEGLEMADLQPLVTILDTIGFVTEEDDTALSSTMVEAWDVTCETFVRTHGYRGGQIKTIAKFFEGYGAIYGLYDANRFDYKTALAGLKDVSERPTFDALG